MENKETALTVWVHHLDKLNEVEMLWHDLKMRGCTHQEEGASQCLRPPIYSVILDNSQLCEKHAAEYLEEDADDIVEFLENIKEGVRQLTRRGLPVSMLAARLASVVLDDCYEEESPQGFPQLIHQELGAAE